MITVNIQNFTQSKVDEEFLKDVTKKVLQELGFKKSVELALVLVGENRIRALNKKYRGKNRVTDVLAFSYSDTIAKSSKELIELGDIVICIPRAKKQARQADHSFEKELAILVIHGMLHLVGYEHEALKNARKMRDWENKILAKIETELPQGFKF